MPAVVKKYPLYVSDEPVTYRLFTGGINTDPNNESLLPNELRDALNVHYQSGVLVKRKGAKLLSNVVCEDPLTNVQGVFLFTVENTYIIVANNGKLYYGIYSDSETINLERLEVSFYQFQNGLIHNPLDMTTGLSYEENGLVEHDGYITTDYNNPYTYKGDFYELESGSLLEKNDFVYADGFWYLYTQETDLEISFVSVTNETYWQETTEPENEIISEWSPDNVIYYAGNIVRYEGTFYECIATHFVRGFDIGANNSFSLYNGAQNFNLIFQNKKEIEGATYNNKFYLFTGTRIVEIYLEEKGKLVAFVMLPKLLNNIIQASIGFNYISPYPELALKNEVDQAITSIGSLQVLYTQVSGRNQFILKPIMTFAGNENKDEYFYRWEKFVYDRWVTVKTFSSNFFATGNDTVTRVDYSYLVVDDADQYQYRVTFAKKFELQESPTETTEQVYAYEKLYDENGKEVLDFKVDRVIGDYFGSAASVIYDVNLPINELFLTIQSCTKVHSDGNKFCLYGDSFNSGEWFKTVIDNPDYIGLRGGLSFKTNKNEELVKVVSFSGYILAFANSKTIGGSIHLIQGNGDDVDTDQYYSPYRRKTISPNISTDNPESIQVAENLLFFKHFKTIYFIQAGDLDQDKVTLYSANDKVKNNNVYFEAPWGDNDCITELTDDYYGILWPEKIIEENGEPIVVRNALRLKLYYKMYQNINGKAYFAWLKDESVAFNTKHIFYVNSSPIYFYNNNIVSMFENWYTDFDSVYECSVRLKSYDLEKPKMFKLLDNATLFYGRNQYDSINVEAEGFNEAGHKIIEWKNNSLLQDEKTLRVGDKLNKALGKLDSTIIDSKVINSLYKFPFLTVEFYIKALSKSEFSFSSVTFNYTTVDIPDQNPYGMYKTIVRKGDDLRVLTRDNTLRESSLSPIVSGSTTVQTNVTQIDGRGVALFISKDEPIGVKQNDVWYDIE